jgi:hypothetical protein
MSAFSGKYGTVLLASAAVNEVTKFTIEDKVNVGKWGSNLSAGWKNAIAGVREKTGTVEFKIPTGGSAAMEAGDSVTLHLKPDGSADQTGPAIIEGVSMDVDVDTGDPVGGSFTWHSNGAWS